MSREAVDRTVREVLATVLGRRIPPGQPVNRAQEGAWDSLAHVNILFSIESELGIQFGAEELEGLNSLDKLVDAAFAHLRASA